MVAKIEQDLFNQFGFLTFSRIIEVPVGSRCIIGSGGVSEVSQIGSESKIGTEEVRLQVIDEKSSDVLVFIKHPRSERSSPSAFLKRADGSVDYELGRREQQFFDIKGGTLRPGDILVVRGRRYEASIKQE